jgi:hypothetical protein
MQRLRAGSLLRIALPATLSPLSFYSERFLRLGLVADPVPAELVTLAIGLSILSLLPWRYKY